MFRNVLSKITIIDEIDKRSIGKKNAYLVRYSYGNICVATLAEKKKKKISQFFATFPKRKKKKGKMINLVGATLHPIVTLIFFLLCCIQETRFHFLHDRHLKSDFRVI